MLMTLANIMRNVGFLALIPMAPSSKFLTDYRPFLRSSESKGEGA